MYHRGIPADEVASCNDEATPFIRAPLLPTDGTVSPVWGSSISCGQCGHASLRQLATGAAYKETPRPSLAMAVHLHVAAKPYKEDWSYLDPAEGRMKRQKPQKNIFLYINKDTYTYRKTKGSTAFQICLTSVPYATMAKSPNT